MDTDQQPDTIESTITYDEYYIEDYERTFHMINIFIQYYNDLNHTNRSIFDNIDHNNPTSTNKQMEILYEHINYYKNASSDTSLEDIGYYDINKHEHLYQLTYDNNNLQCPYLLPILYYIVDNKIKRWNIYTLS